MPMKATHSILLALGVSLPTTFAALRPPAPPVQEQSPDAAMAEMMAKMTKFTQPAEQHELLRLLVGEWEVKAQLIMGGQAGPASDGKSVTTWKKEGRWIESEWSGSLMGMKGSVVHWIGYDLMRQSYVWTGISDFDTAMNRAEGDLTPDGNTLILFGTLDEYITGEIAKMVKYVYRFDGQRDESGSLTSIDSYTLEVHDMPIGETNTMVMQFSYQRAK